MPKDAILTITAETLLNFYKDGLFPMADSALDSGFHLLKPSMRCVFTFENFHIPRSLKKFMRKIEDTQEWVITRNQDFTGVITLCRSTNPKRSETWINQDIFGLFMELHALGHAHSVEVWDAQTGALLGGLYGLALGRVFCGESMVSLKPNVSSVALVYLMHHLKQKGFVLCDAQFENPHLQKFHPEIISLQKYLSILHEGLKNPAEF